MGKKGFLVVIILIAFWAIPFIGHSEDAATAKYIGASKCKMCHRAEYKVWKGSKHATAFNALAEEAATKIQADAQTNADCLKCHIAGADADDTAKAKTYKKEEGITCEACHGAGSLYKSPKVMKDKDAAAAAGLVMPTEETCKKCHNENSPTFKEFKFDEYWEKIKHSKK